MVDNTLYLRTVGGMGNRLVPLLMSLDGIERSGHSFALNWPTTYRKGGHRTKEQNFPLKLSHLYDVDLPIISTEEWQEITQQGLPHYGLKHTQMGVPELRGPDGRSVPFEKHAGNSFTVESHGWLNVDGEGWDAVLRMGKIYDKYLKLHADSQEVLQGVLKKLEGRPSVGAYMRQLHPKLKEWDAYGRIAPKMREHAEEEPDTVFFIISECRNTVRRIVDEFGEDNVVTTPKPGIMNHPEEMRGVVVDIEVMRHVGVYYPTWGSGLARLMSAIRYEEIL
jgi:hypothetical protein|tara:strand:- start:1263 stop:2099 length:837 start_codon:yes stop_codon:yes gene_type:complete